MTTSSLHKINEATFGSTTPFQSIINNILGKYGVHLDKMDTNLVYTLHVTLKNLSFIPVETDQVYIYNICERNTMKCNVNDPMWKLIPNIKGSFIKSKPISDTKFLHSRVFG